MADTSVWIDHLKSSAPVFESELADKAVLMHSSVLGELSLGGLASRSATLQRLRALPKAREAKAEGVMALIENHRLWGRGIGWVDAQLLATVRLDANLALWTRDKRLFECAEDLGVSVSGLH